MATAPSNAIVIVMLLNVTNDDVAIVNAVCCRGVATEKLQSYSCIRVEYLELRICNLATKGVLVVDIGAKKSKISI
jgi:hypothetical protein